MCVLLCVGSIVTDHVQEPVRGGRWGSELEPI